jgi:hypothetical protein
MAEKTEMVEVAKKAEVAKLAEEYYYDDEVMCILCFYKCNYDFIKRPPNLKYNLN